MNAMRAFLRLTGIEILLYLREPVAAFFTFAFAPLMLILFGLIFGNEPRPFYGGRGMVDISVPAYLGMIIATVGLISTPIATAAGRELKVLKRFRATPLSPWIYMAAQIVTYYLVALLGGVALGICGRLLFGMRFDGNPLWVWIGFTVSTLAFISLGFLIAAVVPTARTAQAVGMILAFSLMALGGTWVPLELLPASVRPISEGLPLTRVVLLMRGLWAGASLEAHGKDLGVLLATLVGSGILAARWFRWE
ncbi:ABC transporter permease [Thermoflexus sp.]|uniref:ABC transporter permease n=1 Tax=Thermoflexus sp. TaxID=1969742 RepID=UPI002611FB8E|nr:ABC transporter permease [Thermoflexus sp.]MCX7689401.1 ABC transporter permease [Thermoflexus sp.]MDW8185095.1 ABC transporter permease [Anaerolineae bacterium]